MNAVTLLLFIAGLAMLVAGAELLVRGASRLAMAAGVSPLVIGLTVVAYGTSAPELAVSVQSALSGQADIAVGNVVGSNIFNVLLILGASALITPLVVSRQIVRLDVPLMIGVSVLLFLLALDGGISRLDGALLFLGAVAYTVFTILQGRKEAKEPGTEQAHGGHWIIHVGLVLAGLILLVLGSRWLVQGAVQMARLLGLSELVIGLTIVAAGTSLPEVATSIVAAIRGERDIAVGNVVGSNIFNILTVLGLTGLVSSKGVVVSSAALGFDIPVMIAVAVACLPVFFTGYVIARWEGFLFLGYYAAYALYLIWKAQHHDLLPLFSSVMLIYVLPITAVTLAILVVRAARERPD